MTDQKQRAALLVLTEREKPARARTALEEHDGDAIAALRGTGEQLRIDGGSEIDSALDEADARINAWAADGISLTTVLDAGYPENLRTVYDRPLLLWVRGSLRPCDARSVAVVGARAASPEGIRRAQKLAGKLVRAGYVVVSGLAAGIDRAAHAGALEQNGRTIAVIGTGVNRSYPAENRDLQDRLARETAVISQFPPEDGARRWSFPMRNRVMSGLVRATIVVEASKTSGARMQARIALEHGRPVVLLQSLVEEHEWAKQFAERPGVTVLGDDSLDEVLELFDALYDEELVLA